MNTGQTKALCIALLTVWAITTQAGLAAETAASPADGVKPQAPAATSTPLPAGVHELRYEGGLLTLKADGADLRALFAAIAKATGVEIAVYEGVEGKVTASFEGVTVQEGIRAVLDGGSAAGYGAEFLGAAGEGYALQRVVVLSRKTAAEKAADAPADGADSGKASGLGSSAATSPTGGSTPVTGGSDHGMSQYLEALRSKDRRRVQAALSDMVKRGKAAAPTLLAALEIDDVQIRGSVVHLLWELEVREAVPKILELSNTQDRALRHTAVLALGHLGDRSVVPELVHKLSQAQEPTDRSALVIALGLLEDPRAKPVLEALYGAESNPIVRCHLVGALGRLGDKRGLDFVLEQSRAEDRSLQSAAVGALGQIGDERAIPALQTIIDAPGGGNRESAYLSLRLIQMRRLGAQEKIELLQADLKRGNRIEEWAAGELAALGTPEAVEALKSHAKDDRGRPRRAVIVQLYKLGVNPGIEGR